MKMKKPTQEAVKEFLLQSNAIEGIHNDDSYRQAKTAWDFLMTVDHITPIVVMKTHGILLAHPRFSSDQDLDKKYVGNYRDYPIWVGGRMGMYHTDIPGAVIAWCEEMNVSTEDGIKDQLSQALHVQYEKIHPFGDGNGRTGRMFMNWWRLKNGLPLLTIHAGEEQMEYYKWFKD